MRSFISSIYTLTYIGYVHHFNIEWQTASYTANTGTQAWKPWHHIYSLCKAGEGSHVPQVNATGWCTFLIYYYAISIFIIYSTKTMRGNT